MERAQLAGDRDVAPGVAEPDRRGDVERALAAPERAAPARRRLRPLVDALGEVAHQVVDAHGVAGVRAVADALELDQLGPGALGERRPAVGRDQVVLVALDDEQRTAQPIEQVVHRRVVEPGRVDRVRQRLRRRLERPADGVLDRLGRVRLGIAAVEEEVEIAAVVARPRVAVRARPALVVLELGVEGVAGALGERRGERQGGGEEQGAAHALGMPCGEQQRARRGAAVHADHGVGGAGGVEHGQRVLLERVGPVELRRGRAIAQPVPAPVEGDDAEVTRQVGDLELPEA